MYKVNKQGMPSDEGKRLYGVCLKKLRRGTLFKGTSEKASREEYKYPGEKGIIIGRNNPRVKADNAKKEV